MVLFGGEAVDSIVLFQFLRADKCIPNVNDVSEC